MNVFFGNTTNTSTNNMESHLPARLDELQAINDRSERTLNVSLNNNVEILGIILLIH